MGHHTSKSRQPLSTTANLLLFGGAALLGAYGWYTESANHQPPPVADSKTHTNSGAAIPSAGAPNSNPWDSPSPPPVTPPLVARQPLTTGSPESLESAPPALAENPASSSEDTEVVSPPQTSGRSVAGADAAGKFVTALARDLSGNLWVGTEDQGVLRRTSQGGWTLFTTADGLGDNSGYALCCDRLGRVWVGQLNHGVAVFNGGTWKTYDPISGPLGERVFDIACSPKDGDVWIATSLGLARYSEAGQSWTHFTRADGLPSDQIQALAFAADGTLFVGTQCDGLAIGRPDDNYGQWDAVRSSLDEAESRQPTGKGLPSDLMNDVLVAKDNTVYVATTLGLAKSPDRGKSWSYVRGRDFADKVRGRATPPPRSWREPDKAVMDQLLPEDFVTCLAEDDAGRILVGFRQQGYVVGGPKPGDIVHVAPGKPESPHDWVTALLPGADGETWMGGFGHGLGHTPVTPALAAPNNDPSDKKPIGQAEGDRLPVERTHRSVPPHPAAAKAPTVAELQAWLKRVTAVQDSTPPSSKSWGVCMHDDWTTQGDWFGRIGNQDAVLCAAGSPLNDLLGRWHGQYETEGFVGPHAAKKETLRHWIHWLKSDERRVLYNPYLGYRREAEWDDHGEVYPMTHEGPDVWVHFEVPEGVYMASLYFINPNGHEGPNRIRDYMIELRPGSSPEPPASSKSPPLARARVCHFWHGVYKQFAVRGPNKYWIKIARNGSFNTIVSGVFLDRLEGKPDIDDDRPLPCMWFDYKPPDMPKYWEDEEASEDVLQIVKFQETMQPLCRKSPLTIPWTRPLHLLAHRAALADQTTPKEMIAHWRWDLRLWTLKDRKKHDEAMRTAWYLMCERNPGLEKSK